MRRAHRRRIRVCYIRVGHRQHEGLLGPGLCES
jgi:hypothetical protein